MSRIILPFIAFVAFTLLSCSRTEKKEVQSEQRTEEKTNNTIDSLISQELNDINKEDTVIEKQTETIEVEAPTSKEVSTEKETVQPVVRKSGKLKFDHTRKEFGRITEGDKLSFEFEFTNSGDAPILIKNVLTDCGCTTVDYPKEKIAIGEKGKLKIDFDSAGKLGQQEKIITIVSDGEPRTNILRLIGVVGTD